MISEVYNMDCMEGMRKYPDKFFDLAVVDPPYFSGPEKRKFYGKKVSPIGVKRLYEPAPEWTVPDQVYFNELLRISKNQIIWGINYYDIEFIGSGRIIWDKVNGDSSFSDCEIAYCSLHDSVRLVRYMWNGMMQGSDFKGSMQGNKKLNEKRIHPTQKPIAIYSWIYNKYLPQGGKVIDTHLGSGSNRIAAFASGNIDFYGYEKDSNHFFRSNRWFNQFKQQLTLQFI